MISRIFLFHTTKKTNDYDGNKGHDCEKVHTFNSGGVVRIFNRFIVLEVASLEWLDRVNHSRYNND